VREHLVEGLDGEIRDAVLSAAEALRGAGAEVREVSLPHSAFALAAYTILNTAEASSNLARYDGVRYGVREPGPSASVSRERTRSSGFGSEVKRRILLGTFVLSEGYREAYYARALRARALVARDFEEAFADVDILLGPTAPTPAFRLGEKDRDPLAMYLSDAYTVPSSLAGLPGLSLPCGLSRDGLPLAVQLVGRRFDEATLERVGRLIERSQTSPARRPPLGAGGLP
jgi:aspartyl-tRNA(Asn)/glutamyl-tRNA(Gln) amidotransferase subunit A